jgi:hypothetical protein
LGLRISDMDEDGVDRGSGNERMDFYWKGGIDVCKI